VSLSIDQLESIEALERIEPEWRELWEHDPAATPFESPEWLLPWTRHLWGGGKLRVLAIRSGGSLVGLAPFFHWGYGAKPEMIRVSLLGSGISDHLGMLAVPEYALLAAHLVLEHLTADGGEWHLCDLLELRSGSPLLRTEVPAGLTRREAPCGVCPVLPLPRSLDELLHAVDGKFRHNLRTAQNRLNRDGRIELVRATRPPDVASLMSDLFRLHECRWRERGGAGVPEAGALRRFHLEVSARFAARDMLRLYALQSDGRTIAVQYNFRREDRHFYYLSGFDPEHARSGAGAVLLAETIRQTIAEGAREIDFLRNGEDFKYRWGARDRANRKLLLARSCTYAPDFA
jgi:CelD/BcsL family acetyltransferase involved in cellulose biosynthesis